MTGTRRALLAFAAFILLVFTACSPTSNSNTATGNANTTKPAANVNATNASAANTNAAPRSKPGTGTLEVTSTPPGAGITLSATTEDSASLPQAYGATPAMINDLAPGKYMVQVSKPGYKRFQKEIDVKAGGTVKINATLQK